MASDTQGIALTSPSNEAKQEHGQSRVNPVKCMQQEQDENPENEATGYFNMPHDLLLECKASGNISSLNTAIYLLECAAFGWPPGDKEFPDCMNHLATALLIRFIYTADAKDVLKAVVLRLSALGHQIQDFLQSMVQDRHEYVTCKDMMTSAVMLVKEVLQAHDQATLETAILLYQEGLKLTPETHFQRWRILWELAHALLIQFNLTGNLAQVEEAISYLRQVQQAKPNRSICLLAALTTGHERLMGTGHQAEVVHLQREVIQNDQKAAELMYLGEDLSALFETHHEMINLEGAVRTWQEAELLLAWGHEFRGGLLNNLATAVHTRFEERGDPKDIDEAITLYREALEIRAAPHPNRGMSLNNLANAVHTRFEERGDPKDIDEAITLYREALEIRAAPHPNRGMSLNNLANAVQTRFEQRGDPKDIDEAITLHREALGIRAAPHPHRGHSLNNLANAVQTRFEKQGDPKDIDEAITLHREALEIRAAPHPNRGMSLNNLAAAVQTRFEQRGDPKDIDEAITLHREALEICAAPHPHRGKSLNNLAAAVQTRFEQRGDPKDIDEAITLHREALEIWAAPHPDRGSSLNNLAGVVQTRFKQRGDPKDIDEAIALHREALEIRAAPHPDRGSSLNNLANAVQTRFEQRGDPNDIDEAITLHREVLKICAAPHPHRGKSLSNLANAVQTQLNQQDDPKDIDEAIALHREASTYMYSSPLIRFSASNKWIRSATRHGHTSSLDAYHTAINLLPQLAAFSLDLKSRQQMLARKEIVSLASASATCAIGLNLNNLAVEFLEASRSIFWAQALHLRTPVDKLQNSEPQLASKLRHISHQLEQASFRDISRNIFMDTQHQVMSIEAAANQCRQLNQEWDETVNAIRKVPGFEDFLQPKSIASLRQAAASGPIIILLATRSACSALIVTSVEDVQHVQLPALNVQMVEHYADLPRALSDRAFNVSNFLEACGRGEHSTQQYDLEARLYGAKEGRVNIHPDDIFRRVLADIWQTIVKPVFKKSENPSRLWWCPTGPFSFVPLHAAGIYGPDRTDCVSEYVISSYTPSLTALLDPPTHIEPFCKMTAVVEPHAPKCSPLPGTQKELEKIKSRIPSQWLTALDSTTRDTVIHHLHSSSVIHFACHGTQDLGNPLNSGLILSDGRLNVSRIMHAPEMARNSMKLAFLSACETAKGDTETPDEAMHLAATLLFAGFGGVVATMWRMNDDDGPKIADTFYEYLFKDCSPDSISPSLPDLSKAAKALHLAVTKLYREPSMTFQRWVPFVHYGL
ncbi:CHAT domain-containing protein [Mycena vulgaris]|nr:CHAT domain-containing protein [Mycena vulgaris]